MRHPIREITSGVNRVRDLHLTLWRPDYYCISRQAESANIPHKYPQLRILNSSPRFMLILVINKNGCLNKKACRKLIILLIFYVTWQGIGSFIFPTEGGAGRGMFDDKDFNSLP